MTQELYIQLKIFLSQFSFEGANFYTLHRAFRPRMKWREFVSYVRKMGVYSKVVRLEKGVVQRQLFYDPLQDQYLLKLFPVLGTCPTCEGKGAVEVDVASVK